MAESFFWYDFEATGVVPQRDRPIQVAGIRTDLELNELGTPINYYCQLSDDILPQPQACLVTGITPAVLEQEGLREADFIVRLHAELRVPQTCALGYNSLRFDDEMTRHSLYRNFLDPYEREWKQGNSRWDLIDMVRTFYALRPEQVHWPEQDGRVTLRLDQLTQANGIVHQDAHNALSDVRATIDLARLMRRLEPRLYKYLYALRDKARILHQIRLGEAFVHVSGRYGAERFFAAPVLPLAWHPINPKALIIWDLFADPKPLIEESAATLRQRLYTKRADIPADVAPVSLKLLHINRCPVIAPFSVLRSGDQERLGWLPEHYLRHAKQLQESAPLWRAKLTELYATTDLPVSPDPEQQLYAGFLSDADHHLCTKIAGASGSALADGVWPFADARLPQLLFRYRARNFPETLSVQEAEHWRYFCQERLRDPSLGAPITLAEFFQSLDALYTVSDGSAQQLLLQWRQYAEQRQMRLGLTTQAKS